MEVYDLIGKEMIIAPVKSSSLLYYKSFSCLEQGPERQRRRWLEKLTTFKALTYIIAYIHRYLKEFQKKISA